MSLAQGHKGESRDPQSNALPTDYEPPTSVALTERPDQTG